MALPPKDQRHRCLMFEGLKYTDADIADFEERLERIYERGVHGVHVFDFDGLTDLMVEGLTMIVRYLLVIDMAELVQLQIFEELDDTWAWVAPRPERQPDAAVGALEVTESALDIAVGAQAVPAPVQAPQPPPTAGPVKSLPQRVARLKEEVHGMRGALGEHREVLDSFACDFS
nr:hypothetical protein [Tanacetum cinerariifolium]